MSDRLINQLWTLSIGSVLVAAAGCRPSDVLDVPPPAGEFTYSGIQGQAAVEASFVGARAQLFQAVDEFNGLLPDLEMLSDEFTDVDNDKGRGLTALSYLDARFTAYSSASQGEEGDGGFLAVTKARQGLLVALGGLKQYEPASGDADIAEAYALVGYSELFLAEGYCAGVPLSQILGGGGWSYGTPLSTDSLLGTAAAHFDSALAYATGDDTVAALASVGLGRTRLDSGNFAGAAAAVSTVAPSFGYNAQMLPGFSYGSGLRNWLEDELTNCSDFNVANHKGENGLSFVTAQDPRLIVDSLIANTCDGEFYRLTDSAFYYPLKFGYDGSGGNSGLIPFATGIEAQLIMAEAALPINNASGPSGQWLTILNTLRNSGCGTTNASCAFGTGQVPAQTSGLLPLTDPGTDSGRVSLLFRERAFWLFGTGTRLGDLRRLVRQYGRLQSAVYPTGPYQGGVSAALPSYGTDVDMTLPTPQSGNTTANPYYKGCIVPTTTA